LANIHYDYWTYSIVKVMGAVIQYFIPRNKSKPGFLSNSNPSSKITKRYKVLREVDLENNKIACILNGEIVLKNRPDDGSYQNHKFINT